MGYYINYTMTFLPAIVYRSEYEAKKCLFLDKKNRTEDE